MSDTKKHSGPHYAPLDMAPEKESAVVQAMPYALGITAGIATGGARVWREFYDEIKHYPQVKEMRERRDLRLNNEIAIAEGKKADRKAVAKAVQGIHNDFSKELGAFLDRHMGIKSNSWTSGIQGTFERMPHIKPNNMATIAITAFGSMAVAIGALLMVGQTRRLKHGNTRQDENLRELARRIDAQDAKRGESYSR